MPLHIADNSRPRLAQELLDATLDHLHHDSATLKRCALVSKSFLPTSQRHLFSTFKISDSNADKVEGFFDPTGSDVEDDALRAAVADLLNTYTTDLTVAIVADSEVMESPHIPEFKNVQKIVFECDQMNAAFAEVPRFLPQFLLGTWLSPTSKITSVGFNYHSLSGVEILKSLYVLPPTVENISFAISRHCRNSHATAASFRDAVRRLPPTFSDRGVHHFNGVMKLHLPANQSHEAPLSLMVELKDCFKFNLTRINYRLTSRSDVPHIASLVYECKATLQFLNIAYSTLGYDDGRRKKPIRSFDFSHHRALRGIRIWTPADFDPDWIRAAISSIPKPSSADPRVPPLRIELHISLPTWMVHQRSPERDTPRLVGEIETYWVPVDTQLLRLVGFSPDPPSATSLPGATTAGITLDVTVTGLRSGPGAGIGAKMFPMLSNAKGFLRLV